MRDINDKLPYELADGVDRWYHLKWPELYGAMGKIPSLVKDLDAKIIISSEKGHWDVEYEMETICGGGMASACTNLSKEYTGKASRVYVVDESERSIPDTKRIEVAKAGLIEIYENSGWYTARYIAGLRLTEKGENLPLDDQVEEWVEELSQELDSTDYNDIHKLAKIRVELSELYGILVIKKDEKFQNLRLKISGLLNHKNYQDKEDEEDEI